jgi:hypothetical protein
MRLLELILQPALFRDVAIVGDKMCNLSIVVAQRRTSFFRDENISFFLRLNIVRRKTMPARTVSHSSL